MIKKILGYLGTAIVQISAPELIAISLNVATFVLCDNLMQSAYLWSIVFCCDIAVLCSHGAWVKAGGDKIYGPWRTAAPYLVRFICSSILLIMAAENSVDTVLSTYVWYMIVLAAICGAFYCILLTMHQSNHTWLEGTNGRIGVPNWISITRIALSILVPHLYAVQPFGRISSTIATAILALAIVTDAADGYIARRFDQMTKAGKALDPLGDKVIFYPTVIAFILATSGQVFLEANWMRIAFYVGLGIMFSRDVLFIVWFFLYYTKLSAGIGAGVIDKVRMATMCVWLSTAALALTIPSIQSRMALAGLVCMGLIAALSVASVFDDYGRVKSVLKATKSPTSRPDIYPDEYSDDH